MEVIVENTLGRVQEERWIKILKIFFKYCLERMKVFKEFT